MSSIAPARTDGLAVASFVCALCGFGLIPVVLGHVALARIRRTGDGGMGFAIVGLILGYTALAVAAVAVIAVAAAVLWGVNSR